MANDNQAIIHVNGQKNGQSLVMRINNQDVQGVLQPGQELLFQALGQDTTFCHIVLGEIDGLPDGHELSSCGKPELIEGNWQVSFSVMPMGDDDGFPQHH